MSNHYNLFVKSTDENPNDFDLKCQFDKKNYEALIS